MTIPKEFEMQRKGENISAVERLINNIRNSKITLESYSEHYRNVVVQDQVLLSSIENEINNYAMIMEKYAKVFEKDYVKQAIESDMMPIEVFQMLENLFNYTQRIAELKFIQVEAFKVLSENLAKTLDTVGAIDIKKEALKEFRVMQKEMLEFSKDLANTKLQIMEDKYTALLSIAQDKNEQLVKSLNNDFLCLIDQLVNKNKIQPEAAAVVLPNHVNNINNMKAPITNSVQHQQRPVKYDIEPEEDEEERVKPDSFTPVPKPDVDVNSRIPLVRASTDNVKLMNKVKEAKQLPRMNEQIKKDFTDKKVGFIPNYDNIEAAPDYNLNKEPRFDGDREEIDMD